jgi:hypothetical protein
LLEAASRERFKDIITLCPVPDSYFRDLQHTLEAVSLMLGLTSFASEDLMG